MPSCRDWSSRALKAGDLVELPLGLPDRAFHALRHKERYRTRAADALTDLIKEQAEWLVGQLAKVNKSRRVRIPVFLTVR